MLRKLLNDGYDIDFGARRANKVLPMEHIQNPVLFPRLSRDTARENIYIFIYDGISRLTRFINSPWSLLSLSAYAIKQITENPLSEDETPASRLKQLGMLSMIYHMQVSDIPTTVTNIMKIGGFTRPSVFEVVIPLKNRGLLQEEHVPNSGGSKGGRRAYQYVIPDDLMATVLSTLTLRDNK